MEQKDLFDLSEAVNRMQEENRTLRSALESTDCGRAMLRQGEEFTRLLLVSKLIVSELDLAKVLDLVASNAREIVNAELAIVPMMNEGRDRYTYVAASGMDADVVLGKSFSANIGMCGWVLQHERSLLFGEPSTYWLDEKTAWEVGQQSAVLVPLIGRKGIIGGLSALGKHGGGPFTQHDLDLLTMFANQVSIAIENAQLFQQVTREMDERTQAEHELRQSEKRFRAIFESSQDAIGVSSRAGLHLFANPAYYRLFRLAPEIDLKDVPILNLIAPGSHEQIKEYIRRRARGEPAPMVYETRGLRADGTEFDMDVHISAYWEKNEECTLVILRDTTERRLLDEERLKTQKLEAIGKLAGGIAHDFNNLLQGVFGYLSLAKIRTDNRDKCIAALDQAEQALKMSIRLTNQLLTFSKGGKPAKKTIDLRPVIENAAKFALSGSRTDCRVVVDDGLWQVDADEGQIGQVIQNIVLNADQSMPDGGRVEIMARNVCAPGGAALPSDLQEGTYVEIAIEDNGVGISEQNLSRIFDPYFTTKEKGSGLGLATSYAIMKNHNGSINVQSQMGKGTTFSVYIPSSSAAKIEVPDKPAAATAGRAGRVLVMDDEQVIRDVAGELIRELGHRVEFALHGREALEKYQAAKRSGDPFDVVILDLTIRGGMGGAETMRALLEIDTDVKAVVSSGYSDDAVTSKYREQGFRAFLKKPYTAYDLQEVLTPLITTHDSCLGKRSA